MMGFRETLARVILPGLRTESEIRDLVKDEVKMAKAAMPITANYDPNNEGYRRMTGTQHRRDLQGVDQDRMFEIAYFMFDHSAMTKRLSRMDKSFIFSEPITITAEDEDAQEIIDRFWKDSENMMDMDFPDHMMWLGLLGEQCWPVSVSPHNGHVRLGYVDPANIRDVLVNPQNVKQVWRVDLQGHGGRPGKTMSMIREDLDPRSQSFGRLVGDCFFLAINHPPNSPRGRSDFLTLFDWIDGLERYGYNYLERAEFMLNFVWDVMLKGMNEDQIREWLRDNPAPEPGSVRAHNENVEWKAVSPDIRANDFSGGFDMGKSFIMGAMGRPDSWFGGGGKAYQTEAEQFGQVPIKDLDERQLYYKHVLNHIVRFVLDQAVIAGRISPEKADAGFDIQLPEISKKNLSQLINGVPQLATALSIAEDKGWVAPGDASKVFCAITEQLGVDIEVQDAPAQEADEPADPIMTDDYRAFRNRRGDR